jgi:hypothetical protein
MINGVGETKTLFPNAKVIEHSKDKQDGFVAEKEDSTIPF